MSNLNPAQVPSMEDIYDQSTQSSNVNWLDEEATFHHLVASRFCDRHGPCLVVTGRGYPDVCTREFLHHLMGVTEPRGVPIVALTDGDPHGIEILCTYKFGSKALGFDSAQLAVPTLRWFGIHRYDIDRIPGCQKFLVPLSKADVKKAESLLRRHDIQLSESWNQQLKKKVVNASPSSNVFLRLHPPLIGPLESMIPNQCANEMLSIAVGYNTRLELQWMLRSGQKAEIQCVCSDDHANLMAYIDWKLGQPDRWL
ncbi:endodeoxyribonuclease [Dispira simplex]|nr:endodeoxyribonuclease [Dispira simplex]